jgi:competence protein ComEA
MQYISGIMQRKTLLVALGLIIIGCAVLIWGMLAGGPALASADSAPGAAEVLEDDMALAADDPGADTEAEAQQATPAATPEPAIVVYISGAVRVPDVYRLPAGARIKDVVLAAGGLADDADAAAINLAARLADEQHIHVPRLGEAPPQPATAAEGGAPSGEQNEQGALIDLNQADVNDLEALPGVGQAIAERIVAYREANGPFASVDDLKQVKGIGPALFEKIAPLVRAGP